jgi:hypothetical protein
VLRAGDTRGRIPAPVCTRMRTSPGVAIRRVAISRFVSATGSMTAHTALIDLVYVETDGSTLFLSLTVLFTIGPWGCSSLSARWWRIDGDRKKALTWSDLVHLSLVVGFLAAGPVLAAVGPQATFAIGGVAALGARALAATVRRRAMPMPGEREPSHAERPVAPWD